MPPAPGRPQAEARQATRDQIAVLSTAEGFFGSQVLFALVELGVFEALGADERTAPDLAADLHLPPDRLSRLLIGGVATGLLESSDGVRFRAAPHFRGVLSEPDQPGYLANWLRFMSDVQHQIGGLVEAVRSGRPSRDILDGLSSDDARTRDFVLAMHDFAVLRGGELPRFLDTSDCRSLLDVGCGPGTYAFLLGAANSALALTLIDDAAVLEVAREVSSRYDLGNHIRYLDTDVRSYEFDTSYDLVLLSNVLHSFGEGESRKLLERLYGAVSPGGSVVIQGQFLDEQPGRARWPVLMDLTLMCTTAEGRNHTAEQAREWLTDAGFVRIECQSMSILNKNSYLRGYRE